MITIQPPLASLPALGFGGSAAPVPHPNGEYVLEQRSAGWLELPTGRLIACDPYDVRDNTDELVPYTVALPPGRYEVTLNVARWPDQERIAAARVLVRDEPVASWELALRPGQDPAELDDGELFGFDVEVGMACFVDPSALHELVAVDAAGPRLEVKITPLTAAEAEALEAAMRDAGLGAPMGFRPAGGLVMVESDGVSGVQDARSAAELTNMGLHLFGDERFSATLDSLRVADVAAPGSGANLIAFDSGWGDGTYPVWIGRTATGDVACLVADLHL